MNERRYFTAREAMALTGYRTTHMLDYLARSQIVMPSKARAPGRGRRRLYTFADLVLLRAFNRLLSRGVPVKKLKEGLATLRRKFPSLPTEGFPTKFLITDGTNILFEETPEKILDLNSDGQLVFAFIIDMQAVKREVDEKILLLPKAAA